MPKESYITKLQRENEELRKQLESNEIIKPIEKTDGSSDYLMQPVTIVYGPNRQSMKQETLPLNEAFNRLVDYYSSFDLPTNRNVPRMWNDPNSGDGIDVNNQTVYASISYRDKKQKQRITTIRDLPLWLAVDSQVQQGREVQLISEAEFLEWYKDQQLKDRMSDNTFRNMLRQKQLEQAVNKELQKVEEK